MISAFRSEPGPLYSVYFAPRGYVRMTQMGMQIAQRHLHTFDRLIGIIGDSGSGKSLLVSGMFPGLELTNDDGGVNVRPLPLLEVGGEGFYQPHTYHLDVRFEQAFTQPHVLAQKVREALDAGRRVVVEHFELLYPLLGVNAQLLIGIGDEIIVCRPTLFGPEPEDIAAIVHKSIKFRRMAHSAEDLTEQFLYRNGILWKEYEHDDVRHGFILRFKQEPQIELADLENYVRDKIAQNLSISYVDNDHIRVGEDLHRCTGPRMHVSSTGKIENFRVLPQIHYDVLMDRHLLVGLVGEERAKGIRDINKIYQL